MNYLIEPQKQVEICARAEVLILGGGPSGIAAAIASARSGSKTVSYTHLTLTTTPYV